MLVVNAKSRLSSTNNLVKLSGPVFVGGTTSRNSSLEAYRSWRSAAIQQVLGLLLLVVVDASVGASSSVSTSSTPQHCYEDLQTVILV